MKTPLILCLLMLILASCQPEVEEILVNQKTTNDCQLTKAYYYDNGYTDSLGYVYLGNNIARINADSGYLSFAYSGDKVISMDVHDTTPSYPSTWHDDIVYNSNNQVSLIKRSLTYTGFTQFDSVLLIYSGNKLTRVQDYYRYSTNAARLTDEVVFSYTNNNITKAVHTYYFSPTQPSSDSMLFEYDTSPNYYQKTYKQPILTDAMFVNDYENWPMALSENNVVKRTSSTLPGQPEIFEYTLDAKSNLALVKVDGMPSIRYAYNCK